MASRFEKGVDFGLIVHNSPFMADEKDPLVLSTYIFELLEVNPGVAGFLFELRPDDIDAVVESPPMPRRVRGRRRPSMWVRGKRRKWRRKWRRCRKWGMGGGRTSPTTPS